MTRTVPTWRSWIWGRAMPPAHPNWSSPSCSSRSTATSTRGCETTSRSSSSSWRRTRWAGGLQSSSDVWSSRVLIVSSLATWCSYAGEGVAQPAHPVPQRHSGVLRGEPTAAGRDTEAVPHQVESAGWRESVLAWRALITAVPRPSSYCDSVWHDMSKSTETTGVPTSATTVHTFRIQMLTLQMRRKATTQYQLLLLIPN